MSVRAHRVVKVEYADSPSFNLYGDQKLVEFLDGQMCGGFYSQLTGDGTGNVTVEVETLQEALAKAKELELDEVTVETLQGDIKAAEEADEDSVTYDCW